MIATSKRAAMIDRVGVSVRRYLAQMVAIPLLFVPITAPAADASAWSNGLHSAVRLIGGGARQGDKPTLRAGIEIRLDAGWKTYWRYPGDSGVPPRFAFARSENVKTVTVKWPAPHRFTDDSGQSIGYKDHVLFPLAVEPKDASRPVTLRLDLDYAVCEKLCVPAEAKAELALKSARTSHEAALAVAERRVPQRRLLGEISAFSVRAVRREAPARVVVDVTAPAGTSVELFAEGPTPDWALPLPEPVAGAPNHVKRFAFTLDGLPSGAKPEGALLTLTAVAGEAAIEVTYRLD
jgi:DsbC/DsbD-like thiol-disulfide interchange protein